MANIRTLWLNFVFLLIIQQEEADGSSSITPTPALSSKPSLSLNGNSIATTNETIQPTSITSNVPALSTNATTKKLDSSLESVTAHTTSIIRANPATGDTITTQIITSSRTLSPFISTTSSSVGSGTSGNSDDDSEPKTKLYVWQLVAIGCGAFVLILFIIIGLLCYQNRTLKKKVNSSRNFCLPIKENGAWIDNQDIPLWQKRASAFVNETPIEENPPTLTT